MQKTRDSGKCTKVTRNRDARTQFRRTSTHFLEDTTLCGMLSGLWRNGRVVEGGSLENCCAARYRGFKSYFLRQICHRPGNLPGLFSFKRKATEHGTRKSHQAYIATSKETNTRSLAWQNIRKPKSPWSFTARSMASAASGRDRSTCSQAKSIAISTPAPSSDTDSNGHNRPPLLKHCFARTSPA